MVRVDQMRKRVEYLLGMSVPDERRVQEAVRFQDEFRRRSEPPAAGVDSTTLIRKWRDSRWSS
jgi:hypothetical protein